MLNGTRYYRRGWEREGFFNPFFGLFCVHISSVGTSVILYTKTWTTQHPMTKLGIILWLGVQRFPP